MRRDGGGGGAGWHRRAVERGRKPGGSACALWRRSAGTGESRAPEEHCSGGAGGDGEGSGQGAGADARVARGDCRNGRTGAGGSAAGWHYVCEGAGVCAREAAGCGEPPGRAYLRGADAGCGGGAAAGCACIAAGGAGGFGRAHAPVSRRQGWGKFRVPDAGSHGG